MSDAMESERVPLTGTAVCDVMSVEVTNGVDRPLASIVALLSFA